MSGARPFVLFGLLAVLFIATGFLQGWNALLLILNMGLISAIMSLGVNMQWGYAGLFNVGVMGFTALGRLAVVLVSTPPVREAWAAGGEAIMLGLGLALSSIILACLASKNLAGSVRTFAVPVILIAGFVLFRWAFDPGVVGVEAINPAAAGNLGGAGLPVLLAWPVGAVFAAIAAWIIGKTALGLRSDYLAIATLGIAEIIIALIKNEDWLARGVKNVIGLPRPLPYEVDLQRDAGFAERAAGLGLDPVIASTLFVKLGYSCLFLSVLLLLLWMAQKSLASPWGRMMRAIRDNEEAAAAMGKDVTRRHLQIFILGSAICGMAGAMMTTLEGQFTPGSYQPLRFTFLIWVMVIVGGSGNNLGAVLGGLLIWWLWVEVEPLGQWLMQVATSGMADGSALKTHLLASAAHMRLLTMGLVLLLVLHFSPRGLLPEAPPAPRSAAKPH